MSASSQFQVCFEPWSWKTFFFFLYNKHISPDFDCDADSSWPLKFGTRNGVLYLALTLQSLNIYLQWTLWYYIRWIVFFSSEVVYIESDNSGFISSVGKIDYCLNWLTYCFPSLIWNFIRIVNMVTWSWILMKHRKQLWIRYNTFQLNHTFYLISIFL